MSLVRTPRGINRNEEQLVGLTSQYELDFSTLASWRTVAFRITRFNQTESGRSPISDTYCEPWGQTTTLTLTTYQTTTLKLISSNVK